MHFYYKNQLNALWSVRFSHNTITIIITIINEYNIYI